MIFEQTMAGLSIRFRPNLHGLPGRTGATQSCLLRPTGTASCAAYLYIHGWSQSAKVSPLSSAAAVPHPFQTD